jgi:hypothetical protein
VSSSVGRTGRRRSPVQREAHDLVRLKKLIHGVPEACAPRAALRGRAVGVVHELEGDHERHSRRSSPAPSWRVGSSVDDVADLVMYIDTRTLDDTSARAVSSKPASRRRLPPVVVGLEVDRDEAEVLGTP